MGINRYNLKARGGADLEEAPSRSGPGKFKVGWPGKRIMFEEACAEFERSHFAAISEGTTKGYRAYLKHMKKFFKGYMLTEITTRRIEEYRDHRRQQPSIRYKGRTLKGATVNRELECLTCLLDLAVHRQYIPENTARAVKHFNELRERPAKQMLTLEQENRILQAAAPHLRVGIVLLVQTGGRTYSEGFRLRWDQVDWEHRLIRFGSDVKTPGSSEPLPLTELAFRVLRKWKEESNADSAFIFPSPRKPGRPIPHREDRLEGHVATSGCAAFSDLQLAACVLHTAKLGCTRRCHSKGHAAHEPGNQAPLSTRHGSASSRSDGKGESTGVWRTHVGQLAFYMTLV